MAFNVTQKLISSHLVKGRMTPGFEIALEIDQTLTEDATGTLVMLEFEAMDILRVKTEVSAQYVDHNLLQTDFRNADDHVFFVQRLPEVRGLVQPTRQRCEPPDTYAPFRSSGRDLVGIRQS